MSDSKTHSSKPSIAVIGGGVAGSTIALRLSELGIPTTLFEKREDLISGPPMCHLHAGGNLYREISDEQCFALLKQSIDTLKVYRHCVDWRPTVIALPTSDKSQPSALLPRLYKLQQCYQELIDEDASNAVLGHPDDYFRAYQREELEALAELPSPVQAVSLDDWLIPVVKQLDLDALQYPLFLVQEYGISAFRFAATASLAMASIASCDLRLQHQVVDVAKSADLPLSDSKKWRVTSEDGAGHIKHADFDYVVNACGFQTGKIDDLLKLRRQRLVEFKAAYVARWDQANGQWPEVIIHGERGTPQGMVQLTPYPNGYFQLHGMTQDITLFKDGLVASHEGSAQPKLSEHFLEKIENDWPEDEVVARTESAIQHAALFFPKFKSATVGTKPLFGAQQIPGVDPELRAADVSFCCDGYARSEIVKASSALAAADAVLADLLRLGLVERTENKSLVGEHHFPITKALCRRDVLDLAAKIATQRDYSPDLAAPISSPNHQVEGCP